MFNKVVLVDIVHLPTVRMKVLLRRYPNVTFLTRDISGYDRLAEQSRIKLATGQDDLGVPAVVADGLAGDGQGADDQVGLREHLQGAGRTGAGRPRPAAELSRR